MKLIIALALAMLAVMPTARAAEPMSNVYKGCVIGSIGTAAEDSVDEKYCLRLRQRLVEFGSKNEDRVMFCMVTMIAAWNQSNGHEYDARVPDAVATRMAKACLMIINNVSEETVDRFLEKNKQSKN